MLVQNNLLNNLHVTERSVYRKSIARKTNKYSTNFHTKMLRVLGITRTDHWLFLQQIIIKSVVAEYEGAGLFKVEPEF